MKKTFSGHFRMDEAEYRSIWEKCTFCIDANILLNLYRYSHETSKEFLDLLKKISGRLWISHQAAQEFLDNRLGVISEQGKTYDEMLSSLKEIIENFHNTRRHPFIGPVILTELTTVYEKVKSELEKNQKVHSDRLNEDSLQDEIASLLESKVGPEYSSAEIKSVYKEGEDRYKLRLPPGFKDSNKGSDPNPNKIYGDLIIWKQIMEKARKDKHDIIFITDDRKEYWWHIFSGKTIGPRPELRQEFQTQTKQRFYMYQADRFMEYARKYLKMPVKERAIKEVQDTRRDNEKKSLNKETSSLLAQFNAFNQSSLLNKHKSELAHMTALISNLEKEINNIAEPNPAKFKIQKSELLRELNDAIEHRKLLQHQMNKIMYDNFKMVDLT